MQPVLLHLLIHLIFRYPDNPFRFCLVFAPRSEDLAQCLLLASFSGKTFIPRERFDLLWGASLEPHLSSAPDKGLKRSIFPADKKVT